MEGGAEDGITRVTQRPDEAADPVDPDPEFLLQNYDTGGFGTSTFQRMSKDFTRRGPAAARAAPDISVAEDNHIK